LTPVTECAGLRIQGVMRNPELGAELRVKAGGRLQRYAIETNCFIPDIALQRAPPRVPPAPRGTHTA
jgi:hypothetical protein